MGRIAGANAAGEALPYRPETQGMTFHGINTALFAIGDVGTKPDAQYKILEIRDDKKSTLEKYKCPLRQFPSFHSRQQHVP